MKLINNIKITSSLIFTALLMVLGSQKASAQLTGLESVYFDNQYLANPAMAGIENGLNLNLGYQAQWTSLPGSPKLGNFSADYNSGNRVGLGFMVNNDDAGLISRTRIMATYAYHLPVSENHKLNFGLSAGINDAYIDYSKVNGDQGDPAVELFNQRRVYFDGDLGISYTGSGINLQAALPNIGSEIFNTTGTNLDVDRATFFTSASYKFALSADNDLYSLEPKVVYRGIKGFQNIADIGGNLSFNEFNLNLFALYHTNQSATAGVGLGLSQIRIMFSYTYNTGQLGVYGNDTVEFGLKYMISNKKKE